MLLRLLWVLLCLTITSISYAQHPSAIADFESNRHGILIPRMTETQKDNIDKPTEGLLVYQNNGTKGFYFFDGNDWILLKSLLNDVDGSTTNELIESVSLNGTILNITDAGGNYTADLSALQDGTGTDDQTLLEVLNQSNSAGGRQIKNLANPTNNQDAATKRYVDLNDDVDDADNDPFNELDNTDEQDLTLVGNTLAISNDPNTDVDLTRYLDNTDNQSLSVKPGGPNSAEIAIENGDNINIAVGTGLKIKEVGNFIAMEIDPRYCSDDQSLEQGRFNTNNGKLTIGIEDGSDITVEMDGRYLQKEVDGSIVNELIEDVVFNPNNSKLTVTDPGGNYRVDLSSLKEDADADPQNEIQDLKLDGNILSISDDPNSDVDLSGYLDNTDNQDLKLIGNTLSISNDPNSDVDLSGYLDNTDNQTLSNVLSHGNDGNAKRIKNIADPIADQDAATKNYIDSQIEDLSSDLNDLQSDINDNASDISNAQILINSNSNDIANNASNISDNVNDIARNSSNILDNANDIGDNTDDIEENSLDITDNSNDILNNKNDIQENTDDIAENKSAIDTHVENDKDLDDTNELELVAGSTVMSETRDDELYNGFTFIGKSTMDISTMVEETWTATSTSSNVPSQRYKHSSVWTGSEMIIWGGAKENGGSTTYLNDGAKYNPTTDSWKRISSGPQGRINNTVIWTGSEMIIWGGNNGSAINSGGKFNPYTNTWTPTPSENAPSARENHTAIWTGSDMIIWGGKNNTDGRLNSGAKYNPYNNQWSSTSQGANAASKRDNHIAVWSGTEMIIWAGTGSGTSLNTGARYNPISDNWKPTSTGTNVPSGRRQHAAIWTGSEMIVWGGRNNSTGLLNSGGKYNPNSNSWTPTSTGTNVPEARENVAVIWSGSEMILWAGTGSGTADHTGARYNPTADSWTPTSTDGDYPSARQFNTAVWTGNEMVVWGGGDENSQTNTGGIYYPEGGENNMTKVYYLYAKN